MLRRVLSCPPCMVDVEVNTTAGLSTEYLTAKDYLFDRENTSRERPYYQNGWGLPNARPAHSFKSANVA